MFAYRLDLPGSLAFPSASVPRDTPSPQTVLKVSARVEKYVPHYRGDDEFSILTGGIFTFKTVSPVNSNGAS